MTQTTKAAPVGAGNTGPGAWTPLNLGEPVMPYSKSTHSFPEPTTDLRPSGVADPKPDGCPNCLIRGNQPTHVRWTPDGSGYYATYRCSTCGHGWWTGWGCEPAEVVDRGA